MSDAIEVQGVGKRFGDVVALNGLDLTVPAGTVFALLGPNGAGKTTLVRILATLLAPTSGRAAVLGYDVVREPLAVRRRIGLAGQFAAVDEELTGRENVEMIARLYRLPIGDARRRAADVLERFELVDGRRPSRLDVLRRDAPSARPRRRTDRTAAGRAARRADHRTRPQVAPGAVANRRRATTGRDDGAARRPSTWTRQTGWRNGSGSWTLAGSWRTALRPS